MTEKGGAQCGAHKALGEGRSRMGQWGGSGGAGLLPLHQDEGGHSVPGG